MPVPMHPVTRVSSRASSRPSPHLPASAGERPIHRALRAGLLAAALMLAAAPAHANLSEIDGDLLYGLIAAVVMGPPLVVALAVKRLRKPLIWLGMQVVWIGVLTLAFQLLRAISMMQS